MRLYVSNLAEQVTHEDIHRAFMPYKLSAVEINKGHKAPFAIIKVEYGERALKDMDGSVVKGCQLRVVPAVDRLTQCK